MHSHTDEDATRALVSDHVFLTRRTGTLPG